MPAKTTAPFWSVSLNAGRVRTKHNKPNAQFKRNPTVVHILKEEKKMSIAVKENIEVNCPSFLSLSFFFYYFKFKKV